MKNQHLDGRAVHPQFEGTSIPSRLVISQDTLSQTGITYTQHHDHHKKMKESMSSVVYCQECNEVAA